MAAQTATMTTSPARPITWRHARGRRWLRGRRAGVRSAAAGVDTTRRPDRARAAGVARERPPHAYPAPADSQTKVFAMMISCGRPQRRPVVVYSSFHILYKKTVDGASRALRGGSPERPIPTKLCFVGIGPSLSSATEVLDGPPGLRHAITGPAAAWCADTDEPPCSPSGTFPSTRPGP